MANTNELTSIDTTPLQTSQGAVQPLWLSHFIEVYQQLGTDNLALLDSVYHDQVTFKDPMHLVVGLKDLRAYFDSLYTNLISCQFEITEVMHQDNKAALYWRMTYIHKQLNKAQPITVEGHTKLIAEGDKVIYHRDYVDMGAMVYEYIPLVGRMIKYIKNRAQS
ncbi:nuclear transport factor 2 family protein [Thalassotalea sp. LPB0316]|uniref:nuclear transport factor 2 family protein n=1 Tax=Thalassotalea sp. LPB0316 TaxID=2769490 RepID=UPI0018684856|nr:nuclear transport factor 2 family protein [Thalassotalea sp. LPB0316]QOL27024.1 nuclear transport factor 2 family protein [Thalassotalea sp. LPB0316]